MGIFNMLKNARNEFATGFEKGFDRELEKVANTNYLTRLITLVHNEESHKIGIEIPLAFVTSSEVKNKQALAQCEYEILANGFTSLQSIGNPRRVVYVIDNIEKQLKTLFPLLTMREKSEYYVILHTVRHELRHAWQAINDKGILSPYMDLIPYESYGDRPAEKDANEYAEDTEYGEFEYIPRMLTLSNHFINRVSAPKPELRKEFLNVLFKLHKENAKAFIKSVLQK